MHPPIACTFAALKHILHFGGPQFKNHASIFFACFASIQQPIKKRNMQGHTKKVLALENSSLCEPDWCAPGLCVILKDAWTEKRLQNTALDSSGWSGFLLELSRPHN